ncbi:MAG: LacI family DNA-binding transcriptional regulator, partial [Clostridia bacterium]
MTKPHKARVTLKDIAERMGLSINTVSRSLRGIYPTEEITQRVLDCAKDMGYIGNSIASSMRSGSTRTIAVILGDIANPHYARMVKVMANYLSKSSYTLIIYNTENSLDYEANAILSAIRRGVDGVLICPNEFEEKNVEILN